MSGPGKVHFFVGMLAILPICLTSRATDCIGHFQLHLNLNLSREVDINQTAEHVISDWTQVDVLFLWNHKATSTENWQDRPYLFIRGEADSSRSFDITTKLGTCSIVVETNDDARKIAEGLAKSSCLQGARLARHRDAWLVVALKEHGQPTVSENPVKGIVLFTGELDITDGVTLIEGSVVGTLFEVEYEGFIKIFPAPSKPTTCDEYGKEEGHSGLAGFESLESLPAWKNLVVVYDYYLPATEDSVKVNRHLTSHEVGHVLLDSREHSGHRGNIMYKAPTKDSYKLTTTQKEKVVKVACAQPGGVLACECGSGGQLDDLRSSDRSEISSDLGPGGLVLIPTCDELAPSGSQESVRQMVGFCEDRRSRYLDSSDEMRYEWLAELLASAFSRDGEFADSCLLEYLDQRWLLHVVSAMPAVEFAQLSERLSGELKVKVEEVRSSRDHELKGASSRDRLFCGMSRL